MFDVGGLWHTGGLSLHDLEQSHQSQAMTADPTTSPRLPHPAPSSSPSSNSGPQPALPSWPQSTKAKNIYLCQAQTDTFLIQYNCFYERNSLTFLEICLTAVYQPNWHRGQVPAKT